MNMARNTPADLAARVGQEIGVSSWIAVDQSRIDEFAHCTDDHQWIHVDVERATRESPFKAPIAHGYLTLALLAPMSVEALMSQVQARQVVNYGLDKVRFLAPVRAGRRIRNRVKIVAVEDKGQGRWLLTSENTVEIEGEDKPALIATALAMLMF
ncbi:MAG: MaoC family dehydratase [Burkholderiales bacterium]|nr:MaoC family dehydratase [Burkholderiales bacterium]MDE2398519.1 MaoC family dehydratase [Burkholderiales bacterium]MDE2454069.1 MaoC family dehydratase [Burkholderiales bacterium]